MAAKCSEVSLKISSGVTLKNVLIGLLALSPALSPSIARPPSRSPPDKRVRLRPADDLKPSQISPSHQTDRLIEQYVGNHDCFGYYKEHMAGFIHQFLMDIVSLSVYRAATRPLFNIQIKFLPTLRPPVSFTMKYVRDNV